MRLGLSRQRRTVLVKKGLNTIHANNMISAAIACKLNTQDFNHFISNQILTCLFCFFIDSTMDHFDDVTFEGAVYTTSNGTTIS